MIIVTGATGHLGHTIAEKLVDRVTVSEVGVSVRDPEKAADLKELGVRVRRGDFEDPESLRHAFEGATQVLIVSSNAGASGGDPLAQHRSAIEAARAAGARRIVYTSHMAASASSASPRCSTMPRPKTCCVSPGSRGPRFAMASTRRAASCSWAMRSRRA